MDSICCAQLGLLVHHHILLTQRCQELIPVDIIIQFLGWRKAPHRSFRIFVRAGSSKEESSQLRHRDDCLTVFAKI